MNNKQIKKEAQKLYNPKTAFGNSELIGLLKKVKVPNSDGNFEVVGSCIIEIIGVNWECASCGNYNRDKVIQGFGGGYEDIEAFCKKCKAKHLVEVVE